MRWNISERCVWDIRCISFCWLCVHRWRKNIDWNTYPCTRHRNNWTVLYIVHILFKWIYIAPYRYILYMQGFFCCANTPPYCDTGVRDVCNIWSSTVSSHCYIVKKKKKLIYNIYHKCITLWNSDRCYIVYTITCPQGRIYDFGARYKSNGSPPLPLVRILGRYKIYTLIINNYFQILQNSNN